MAFRLAEADWKGDMHHGQGQIVLGSGTLSGFYSYRTRMQEGGRGTSPEELLGSALAASVTLLLAAQLDLVQYPPVSIYSSATVQFIAEKDEYSIPVISLVVQALVPGIDEESFQHIAQRAIQNCPVARALAGTAVVLRASLRSETEPSQDGH